MLCWVLNVCWGLSFGYVDLVGCCWVDAFELWIFKHVWTLDFTGCWFDCCFWMGRTLLLCWVGSGVGWLNGYWWYLWYTGTIGTSEAEGWLTLLYTLVSGFLLIMPPLYQVVANLVPSEYLAAFVLLVFLLICCLSCVLWLLLLALWLVYSIELSSLSGLLLVVVFC
jgi:hypothetical protein